MIHRACIAATLLIADSKAHAKDDFNSEFYNTLKSKANAYYNPTMHMND